MDLLLNTALTLLLALSSPNQAHAEDCVQCQMRPPNNTIQAATLIRGSYKAINEKLYGCSTNAKRMYAEAVATFDKLFPPTSIAPVKIAGVSFCGKSDEASFMEKFVGAKPPLDWLEKTKQKCLSKNNDCADTRCSLALAFGSPEAGIRALIVAKRDGYIFSIDQTPIGPLVHYDGTPSVKGSYVPGAWNAEDIRIMDRALARFPDQFRRLKSLARIKKLPKEFEREGSYTDAVAWYATKDLVLMPKAFRRAGVLEETVTHELAHFFDAENTNHADGWSACRHFKLGFHNLSGWDYVGEKYVFQQNANFSTAYAKETPFEDFAETVTSYMRASRRLKERAPDKYSFMKERVFDGKEYMSDPICQPFL